MKVFPHLTRLGHKQRGFHVAYQDKWNQSFAFVAAFKRLSRKYLLYLIHIMKSTSLCISSRFMRCLYLSGFCWKFTSFTRRLKSISMHGRGTLFLGWSPPQQFKLCTFNVVHEHLVLGSFLSPSLRECWYSIVVSHESGPHWTTSAGTGKGERKEKTWLNRQSKNRTHSKASDKNTKNIWFNGEIKNRQICKIKLKTQHKLFES